MSVKKVHENQPKEFKFSEANLKKVEQIFKKYPEKNLKSHETRRKVLKVAINRAIVQKLTVNS